MGVSIRSNAAAKGHSERQLEQLYEEIEKNLGDLTSIHISRKAGRRGYKPLDRVIDVLQEDEDDEAPTAESVMDAALGLAEADAGDNGPEYFRFQGRRKKKSGRGEENCFTVNVYVGVDADAGSDPDAPDASSLEVAAMLSFCRTMLGDTHGRNLQLQDMLLKMADKVTEAASSSMDQSGKQHGVMVELFRLMQESERERYEHEESMAAGERVGKVVDNITDGIGPVFARLLEEFLRTNLFAGTPPGESKLAHGLRSVLEKLSDEAKVECREAFGDEQWQMILDAARAKNDEQVQAIIQKLAEEHWAHDKDKAMRAIKTLAQHLDQADALKLLGILKAAGVNIT